MSGSTSTSTSSSTSSSSSFVFRNICGACEDQHKKCYSFRSSDENKHQCTCGHQDNQHVELKNMQQGAWVRDLTREGVEANPGPCNGGTDAIDGKCPQNCAVFVPNEEKKNSCDYCMHHKACHTDVAGTVNAKRKSLPPSRSGSKWTGDDLQRLNIVILPVPPQHVIGVDLDEKLPPLSDRAQEVLSQCLPLLEVPNAVDKIFLGQRVGSAPDQDPRNRSGVGWVLLKYLSLMVGQGRINLESVVDDFLIHLLVALGYNDGDLVVLSKNQLDMTMNRSHEYATADLTVFDVMSRFRLVVTEEKREQPSADKNLDNYEAQLVAEALAAAQANVSQKKKRHRSISEGGDVHSSPAHATATAGVIYLVRVVGPVFSFYSINPSMAFIDIFQDYTKLGDEEDLPITVVSKCSYTFPPNPLDPSVSHMSADDRTFTEFNFLIPSHRQLIIHLLDWIHTRISA